LRAELYDACLHEVAHKAVAERLGYQGVHVRIWRTWPTDDTSRAFNGQTYVFDEIRTDHERWICLAGAIAELLAAANPPSASILHGWLKQEGGMLSGSDAVGAEGFNESDTRRALELVRWCWPAIEDELQTWLTAYD